MKRLFAFVALLAALGVFFKLAVKTPRPEGPSISGADGSAGEPKPEEILLAKYSKTADKALVERTLKTFRQTAVNVERTDGLRGLALLDKLDIEAVYLYEKYPSEFRRLRETLNDDSAAELLLHWREYFGLKRADEVDRGILISEISRLSSSQKKIAAKFPSALPIILADPAGVTELAERWSGDPKELEDLLVILDFISLESGSADLRKALRTVDDRGQLALNAFRAQGLDGFALVTLYGPVLDALGDALPLDQALILLRVNSDYVDDLLASHEAETVAAHLRHVAALNLVDAVGSSPNALRLLVEHGERGAKALSQAGPDAADVVYDDFAEATLRNQAVEALAEHGPMALAVLDKYSTDQDFREILRAHGAAVIPPIARVDMNPETLTQLEKKPKWTLKESLAHGVLYLSGDSGQATIKTIKNDGLERVASLDNSEVAYYQFLPLYDLLHLGNVVRHGYAPSKGEITWAVIDGCFVIFDALSLAAVQPEGVVFSEAARAEVKAATREGVKAFGVEAAQESVEAVAKAGAIRGAAEGAEGTAERVARWWAVRKAGGTYKLLRKMPEASPRLGVSELAEMARPLCSKAGLRLSQWGPVRLLKNGEEVLLRIPPEKGLKYLGKQAAVAGVGIVGFRKMEEHLSSRRPQVRAE